MACLQRIASDQPRRRRLACLRHHHRCHNSSSSSSSISCCCRISNGARMRLALAAQPPLPGILFPQNPVQMEPGTESLVEKQPPCLQNALNMFERFPVGLPHEMAKPVLQANCEPAAAWVQRREEDDGESPRFPPAAYRRPPERSVHDAQRESTPVTPSAPSQQVSSRWRNFVEGTSAYPPNTEASEKDGTDWLAEQPDLTEPWLSSQQDPGAEREGSSDDQRELFGKRKRRIWYKQIHVRPSLPPGATRLLYLHICSTLFGHLVYAAEQSDRPPDVPLHHLAVVAASALACRQHLPHE